MGDRRGVVAGLRAAIETPLGPWPAGSRCGPSPAADRLDELGFELPLAGGEGARDSPVDVAAIGGLLRAAPARR